MMFKIKGYGGLITINSRFENIRIVVFREKSTREPLPYDSDFRGNVF